MGIISSQSLTPPTSNSATEIVRPEIFRPNVVRAPSPAGAHYPSIFETTACPICHDCVLGPGPANRTTPRTVHEFKVSSRAGCAGCRMVLDAVEAYEPGWARKHSGHHSDANGGGGGPGGGGGGGGRIQLGLNYDVLSVYLLLKDGTKCEKFEIFQSQVYKPDTRIRRRRKGTHEKSYCRR
ncbi:hypothetical protein AOQ84DRAFT_159983 [Glonium stellatum]|uniref:Uncharacterized protein n=1 Tax=Glonium stellatum TaxID=574774 RepID=A0A8E2JZN4_9PEZI|nr:hypothetical protein AOQ84DRAFT_159983 [Glonium stellatum]